MGILRTTCVGPTREGVDDGVDERLQVNCMKFGMAIVVDRIGPGFAISLWGSEGETVGTVYAHAEQLDALIQFLQRPPAGG